MLSVSTPGQACAIRRLCNYCEKLAAKICAGCRAALHCSRDYQQKVWYFHNLLCRQYPEHMNSKRPLQNHVRSNFLFFNGQIKHIQVKQATSETWPTHYSFHSRNPCVGGPDRCVNQPCRTGYRRRSNDEASLANSSRVHSVTEQNGPAMRSIIGCGILTILMNVVHH
ncbi:hypothetical protein BKA67DRAFT_533454 [Truncatella angustata]|uniref:MYND-type domain-containing protein n=1 Tax=Truncatella angustata TaxID=152316 RepID=A0A9P9A2K0_9PEZI|nr:uncharacterized protein BKA67DRAFT_533454 [Truncatella angustata]KAH6658296.1 hypothetical protein BKA67DRAFT_533454 [Truncatella angustata]